MDALAQAFEILVVSLTALSFVALAGFTVSDIIAERRATQRKSRKRNRGDAQGRAIIPVAMEFPKAA